MLSARSKFSFAGSILETSVKIFRPLLYSFNVLHVFQPHWNAVPDLCSSLLMLYSFFLFGSYPEVWMRDVFQE